MSTYSVHVKHHIFFKIKLKLQSLNVPSQQSKTKHFGIPNSKKVSPKQRKRYLYLDVKEKKSIFAGKLTTMIQYSIEQLSEDNFEKLVADLCKYWFGEGIHSYAKGKDAGRDCYFDGTANSYPSESNPWSGKIIIQAKHTSDLNASCSDNAFFSNQSSILNKELEKIKNLIAGGEKIDGYLIVTNRKLTGGIHPAIKKHIEDFLSITQVDVVGIEDLQMHISCHSELVKKYGLLSHLMPDRFYEIDIRNVILLFAKDSTWKKSIVPVNSNDLSYIDKIQKNKLNDVDEAYFASIKEHSLKFFDSIDDFLKDPRNEELLDLYENTVSDLRGYILKNLEHHSFTQILEFIIDTIAGEPTDSDIFRKRSLVRVFVHYMYWNCDIGRKS